MRDILDLLLSSFRWYRKLTTKKKTIWLKTAINYPGAAPQWYWIRYDETTGAIRNIETAPNDTKFKIRVIELYYWTEEDADNFKELLKSTFPQANIR